MIKCEKCRKSENGTALPKRWICVEIYIRHTGPLDEIRTSIGIVAYCKPLCMTLNVDKTALKIYRNACIMQSLKLEEDESPEELMIWIRFHRIGDQRASVFKKVIALENRPEKYSIHVIKHVVEKAAEKFERTLLEEVS